MAVSRDKTPAEGIDRVLSEWIRNAIHTALPGIVDEFNLATRRARVRIAIEALRFDGECFERAPLLDVPVIFPAGAGGMILIQLQRGDSVWVMFSERGLQTWKETFKLSPPNPQHLFAVSDAVALPGFGPHSAVTPAANDGVCVQSKDATVSVCIRADGNIDLNVADGKRVNIGGSMGKRLVTEDFLTSYNTSIRAINGGNAGTVVTVDDYRTDKVFGE